MFCKFEFFEGSQILLLLYNLYLALVHCSHPTDEQKSIRSCILPMISSIEFTVQIAELCYTSKINSMTNKKLFPFEGLRLLTENAGVRGGGSRQRQHELSSDTLTCEQEKLSCIMYGKALLKERKQSSVEVIKNIFRFSRNVMEIMEKPLD